MLELQESAHKKPGHISYPWFYKKHMAMFEQKVVSLLWQTEDDERKNMKYILSANFNVPIELVSNEEIKDLRILFSYLLPRVLHAQVQFRWLNKPWSNPKIPSTWRMSMIWHDLSHSIARYILDKENKSEDPWRFTPTPFKYRHKWYAEHYDALAEELYTSIWMRSWIWEGGSLLPLVLLKKEKSISSGEDLYKKYIDYNLNSIPEFKFKMPLYTVVPPLIFFPFHKLPHLQKRRQVIEDLRGKIAESEFPKLRELLYYIYENREKPRVLLDLFFQEMQPLIEQLKKRNLYIYENRILKNNPQLS
jgi:hypothetical protein